jgi:hypothetical protein
VALLDALRALSEFEPPAELPPCDLGELADVLEAHGLAPLASYQVETRRIGMRLPEAFRERLLTLYQGTVNDNVTRLLTLKKVLDGVRDVPVLLLEGAAYVDWLYPHLGFRPVGEVRLAVRGEDAARFAAGAAPAGFGPVETGAGGHTATFGDGLVRIHLQEGVVAGGPAGAGLFERRRPYPAFGPAAARPGPEDALLVTVADQAALGLHAPLVTFVDLRELLRQPDLDPEMVRRLAAAAGLSRALHGSLSLVAWFFPAVADRALALRPGLPAVERLAVDAVVESARDPARLRHLRGSEAAARLVVAPR